MTMKTQMDKLVGYQTGGSPGGIDPSQRRIVKKAFRPPTDPEGERITLPIEGIIPIPVVKEGVRSPTDPEDERFRTLPIDEGYRTIQPVPGVRPTFPTVGSPEYERYLEAIKNLPEGGLENLLRITAEPDTPTTELSPGGPHTSFVGGRDPMSVVLGLIHNKDSDVSAVLDSFNQNFNDGSDITPDQLAEGAKQALLDAKSPLSKLARAVFDRSLVGQIRAFFDLDKDVPTSEQLVEMTREAAEVEAQSTNGVSAEAAAAITQVQQGGDWGAIGALGAPGTQPGTGGWGGIGGLGTPGTQSGPSGSPAIQFGAAAPTGPAPAPTITGGIGGLGPDPTGVGRGGGGWGDIGALGAPGTPRNKGGIVQNMYDGGVVGKKKETKLMYDGGLV